MTVIPVTPVRVAGHPIYAVAGGNHVTIQLDRALTGGDVDTIEVLDRARPGQLRPASGEGAARAGQAG
jgi:hypothetical protein